MKATIIVATYGDPYVWGAIARRALRSAEAQSEEAEVLYVHADTLHEARNRGADDARGDWLIFLDADDELDPGYVTAMGRAADAATVPMLLQPALLRIHDGIEEPSPILIPERPLIQSNYMVIGTAVQRDLFLAVGGFHDYPLYEDWELWIRCWLAGARSTAVQDAIYRAHVNPAGRNSPAEEIQLNTYRRIRRLHERAWV